MSSMVTSFLLPGSLPVISRSVIAALPLRAGLAAISPAAVDVDTVARYVSWLAAIGSVINARSAGTVSVNSPTTSLPAVMTPTPTVPAVDPSINPWILAAVFAVAAAAGVATLTACQGSGDDDNNGEDALDEDEVSRYLSHGEIDGDPDVDDDGPPPPPPPSSGSSSIGKDDIPSGNFFWLLLILFIILALPIVLILKKLVTLFAATRQISLAPVAATLVSMDSAVWSVSGLAWEYRRVLALCISSLIVFVLEFYDAGIKPKRLCPSAPPRGYGVRFSDKVQVREFFEDKPISQLKRQSRTLGRKAGRRLAHELKARFKEDA